MNRVIAALALFSSFASCNSATNKKIQNKELSGTWYFADIPDSYIEITNSTYTEHTGAINSIIKYTINWIDSSRYELTVTEIDGPVRGSLTHGDKISISIFERTPDYFRCSLTYKSKSHCIRFIRHREYDLTKLPPCTN